MHMALETPDLSHTSDKDWANVYEPAEDSFLLLDALENDLEFIKKKKPSICLEVGSGSGVVISAIAKVLSSCAFCLAIDINRHACALTHRTCEKNGVSVDVVNTNLIDCLRGNSIDMVLFNPPYVVTPPDEIGETDIARAWAGGSFGREVIDQFLFQVTPHLSVGGFGYIILLRENNPEDVARVLEESGCRTAQIAQRKLRGEFLVVLRFEKN